MQWFDGDAGEKNEEEKKKSASLCRRVESAGPVHAKVRCGCGCGGRRRMEGSKAEVGLGEAIGESGEEGSRPHISISAAAAATPTPCTLHLAPETDRHQTDRETDRYLDKPSIA